MRMAIPFFFHIVSLLTSKVSCKRVETWTYRARERVTHHEVLRNTELTAHLAHLVLEELTERLQQLQAVSFSHALGETAL